MLNVCFKPFFNLIRLCTAVSFRSWRSWLLLGVNQQPSVRIWQLLHMVVDISCWSKRTTVLANTIVVEDELQLGVTKPSTQAAWQIAKKSGIISSWLWIELVNCCFTPFFNHVWLYMAVSFHSWRIKLFLRVNQQPSVSNRQLPLMRFESQRRGASRPLVDWK